LIPGWQAVFEIHAAHGNEIPAKIYHVDNPNDKEK